MDVKLHDIIQLTETAQEDWGGCLMIVKEICDWGVLAYVKIPEKGDAFLRVRYGQFVIVGAAAFVRSEYLVEEEI